jgi:hypothetical protein
VEYFLRKWGRKLEADLHGRNLFLPVALNGMGQEAPVGSACRGGKLVPWEWEWYVDPRQAQVADHLVRTQPMLSWDSGPQLPGPGGFRASGPRPWDVPVARPDADALEAELAVYAKRERFRVAKAVYRKVREPWCCGKPLTTNWCECGAQNIDCPESEPLVQVETLTCGCQSASELAWERAGAPQDENSCRHELKRRVVVRWVCACHGLSPSWRLTKKPNRWVPRDFTGCVRPSLVYAFNAKPTGEPARQRMCPTWGTGATVRDDGLLEGSYGHVKFVPVSEVPDACAALDLWLSPAAIGAFNDRAWDRLVRV